MCLWFRIPAALASAQVGEGWGEFPLLVFVPIGKSKGSFVPYCIYILYIYIFNGRKRRTLLRARGRLRKKSRA